MLPLHTCSKVLPFPPPPASLSLRPGGWHLHLGSDVLDSWTSPTKLTDLQKTLRPALPHLTPALPASYLPWLPIP